ncbi:MAG TPA: porin, partial [Opitutales bacterium]|nr:porin [Opitutales bacterium]
SDAEEISQLRQQMALLQRRLDAIEAREAAQAAEAAKPQQAPAPTAAAAPAAKPAPDAVTVKLGSKGLSFATADKKYTFSIRTRLQADAHFFPDASDGNNDFSIRRAILSFRGSAGYMNWVFSPNFGGGSTVIDDAWIEIAPSDLFHLAAGKIQSFEGLENIQSNAKLLFAERGLPSNLVPGREIGLKLTGNLPNKFVNYGLALTDAALDSTSQNTNANLSGDLGGAANITLTPYAEDKDAFLSGLAVGLSVSASDEKTTIDSTNADRTIKFKSAGRATFITIQNGVAVDGMRGRINPQLYYYHGPFGFLSEYVASKMHLSRGGIEQSITNRAWTAQASWVITGENASYSGVKPAHPFAFGADGGWGAFEIGARYNSFKGDDALFSGGASTMLATSASTQKADAWGLAIKWYLTENLLWALNFENTDFGGLGADRDTEQAFTTRMQIDF